MTTPDPIHIADDMWEAQQAKIDKLAAELATVREALAKFADHEHWEADEGEDGRVYFWNTHGNPAELARAALSPPSSPATTTEAKAVGNAAGNGTAEFVLGQGDDVEEEDPHCENCGRNLEVDPCVCGPAGPRLGGVWTGQNGRQNAPERDAFPPLPYDPPKVCARCGHDMTDHIHRSGMCRVLNCACDRYTSPEVA